LDLLNIGGVKLDNNVFLAPMAGITDRAFRMLCKEQGCGLSYTEMVSAKGLHYENKRTENLLNIQPGDRPVAVQLFGSDPVLLAEQAARLCEQGADIIDINMGCPTPKIVRNGDGCALMQKPALVGEIVKRVSCAIKTPLTVKIRKGWDQNSVNAVEIARIAEQNGAAAVAVHGRTREQFYSGTADWGIIAEVKKALSIPVIGSGDIFTPEDAAAMLEKTGCDAVMIARGARGNPWIFKRTLKLINEGAHTDSPGIKEVLAMIRRHVDLCMQHKGEKVAVREMRKHVGWYLKGFRNVASIRKEANDAQTREQLFRLLEDYEKELERHP
jgi:tRNA-dihydrouridine synthase B